VYCITAVSGVHILTANVNKFRNQLLIWFWIDHQCIHELTLIRAVVLYATDAGVCCCGYQLFRKDLISAMKLADSEALRRDDYLMISDHWRQEWEKGVQVPVNPDVLKLSQVKYANDTIRDVGRNLTNTVLVQRLGRRTFKSFDQAVAGLIPGGYYSLTDPVGMAG